MAHKLLRTSIALALAWQMVPGTSELLEQVVHLARNGHLAHSIPDDPDASPPDVEHGCQGPMHLCQCCHTAPILISAAAGSTAPLVPAPSVSWAPSVLHDDPHLDGIFHPPQA